MSRRIDTTSPVAVLRWEARNLDRTAAGYPPGRLLLSGVAERLEHLADWIEAGKPLPGPRKRCRCGASYYELDGHVCCNSGGAR